MKKSTPEHILSFGARNKKEAAKTARKIVRRLISQYVIDAGQPHSEAFESGVPMDHADRLRDAILHIRDHVLVES